MKLYLSSYRLGDESATFGELVTGQRRVAVIRNALDFSNDRERLIIARKREFSDLESLGLKPFELDLRDYFGRQSALYTALVKFDAVWVVGGNAFILRRAMRQSGLDYLLDSNSLGPEFVYAGYSAGICAVSLTLRGIDCIDSPDIVPDGYPVEPIWDGVGLVPFAIAPHYRSGHPESAFIEKAVAHFDEQDIPYIALRDGEVFIGETLIGS